MGAAAFAAALGFAPACALATDAEPPASVTAEKGAGDDAAGSNEPSTLVDCMAREAAGQLHCHRVLPDLQAGPLTPHEPDAPAISFNPTTLDAPWIPARSMLASASSSARALPSFILFGNSRR